MGNLPENITNAIDMENLQQLAGVFAVSGIGTVIVGVLVFLSLLSLVARWKIYSKAGRPGWYALIPFLNGYTLWDVSMGKGILFLSPLLSIIPFVGGIIALVLNIMRCIRLSERFGKGTGFGIGLWLLSAPFMCILAFGFAEYGEDVPTQKPRKDNAISRADYVQESSQSVDDGIIFTPWRLTRE